MNGNALGLLETIGLTTAIEAADIAVKSASVQLEGVTRSGAGLVAIRITGDIASVKAAIEAARTGAERIGTVHSCTVIGRATDGLKCLFDRKTESIQKDALQARLPVQEEASEKLPVEKPLEKMRVVDLRQLARSFESFPISKNEITFARKKELIELIEKFQQTEE